MRWVALLVVSACGFAPAGKTDGHVGSDGTIGTEQSLPVCYGTGLGVQVCPATPPASALMLIGTKTYDTDMGSQDCATLIGPTMNDYCVVAGKSITINGFVYAHGTRPLLLLSLTTLDVFGTIDVASHNSSSPQLVGAGGDDGRCGGQQAIHSTGAGFGGTLGTKGGNGGTTMADDGWAEAVQTITTLHGGCGGGYGLD